MPIGSTILLQGGSRLNFEPEAEEFFAAKDGRTLSKAIQPLGGLAGLLPKSSLPRWLWPEYSAIVEGGFPGVGAITELARPASEIGIDAPNLAIGEGVGLRLPVKIHLENPLLGSECYIGSYAHPVYLDLTDGVTSPPAPTAPISGSGGQFVLLEESAILVATGVRLVDNTFAVPAATGCGGIMSSLIDPVVSAQAGLPAAAGKSKAVFAGDFERGYAPAVRRSIK